MTITTIERCELCGQAVDPGDLDSVQIHAGIVGGFVHASCLEEYDDAETGENEKSA